MLQQFPSFLLTRGMRSLNVDAIDFNCISGDTMIDRRKLLLTTLTPILAGFFLVGSTFASSRKERPARHHPVDEFSYDHGQNDFQEEEQEVRQGKDRRSQVGHDKATKETTKSAKATKDEAKSDTTKATKRVRRPPSQPPKQPSPIRPKRRRKARKPPSQQPQKHNRKPPRLPPKPKAKSPLQ